MEMFILVCFVATVDITGVLALPAGLCKSHAVYVSGLMGSSGCFLSRAALVAALRPPSADFRTCLRFHVCFIRFSWLQL